MNGDSDEFEEVNLDWVADDDNHHRFLKKLNQPLVIR